jgi:DNA-binding MarR family transcriptional regulator
VTPASTKSPLTSVPAPASTPAAPAASTSTAQLSAQVVRLVRASHGFRAQMHAAKPDGIEWAGSMLLLQLCKDGPQRSSALAAAVCVDPSTVSRQIGDLVDLGLVERRADPHDGRATLLAATQAGQTRYQQLHERRDRAFALMLADWSDTDVSALVDLLSRLNDSLIDSRAPLLEAITQHPMRPSIDEPTLDVQENA